MATTQLAKFGVQHVARGVSRLTNEVITSAKGSYVTMDSGRKLLDFTTGIGVTGLGHCHPKVSEAAAKQCMTLVHGQCSIAFHDPYLKLIEKLLPVMPDKSLDTFFFWNSGTEAVEAAVRVARATTGRQNIISMQGGYHGRTLGAVALTRSKTVYGEGVGPLIAGSYVTPFPCWHQLGLPADTPEQTLVQQSLHQLQLLLSQQTAPSDTAAILIEPVIGEGGYVPAPESFLRGLREICNQHGILLIFDEVQCGFGRTGRYFYSEYSGIVPDIMVMAKGLANGFPLSGIVSRKEIMDKQKPGTLGGTYAGNAVACAAAIACADVMKEENILHNVQERSKELFSALEELRKDPATSGLILDIRGKGLMVGVEFPSPTSSVHDPFTKAGVPQNIASRVSAKCLEKGLMLLTTSVFQVVRFMPPLNITKEELANGIKIFQEAVREVAREG